MEGNRGSHSLFFFTWIHKNYPLLTSNSSSFNTRGAPISADNMSRIFVLSFFSVAKVKGEDGEGRGDAGLYSRTSLFFVQDDLFSQLSCHFTDMVEVHQRVQSECLNDPQCRSQQCQRVPSVRVNSDKMIGHSKMSLSRFSPDAQPKPAMRSRINTKKGRSACNTSCQPTRKLEPRHKGPVPATRILHKQALFGS